ncbi:MAG: signal recognition particle-docking protein FtsY [Rhodospirillales bacterium]|jgi:fused signal recognition particle receptor|nr:signal recognition particle-docking protein FtsY [Rhodospirillales bacterium]
MSDGAGKDWLGRLRAGLDRSSAKLGGGISDLFTKRRLDGQTLDELRDLLISADLGVATAERLTASLAESRFDPDAGPEGVRAALAGEIAEILQPVARPLFIDGAHRPHVIVVCGVNGSGKTTTIAKLAKQFKDQGHSVVLAAGDTFRAAAMEQLQVWAERAGCPVIARESGADAAGLAYDALAATRADGTAVLIVDTAGRLHNKADLMAELQKIVRAMRKFDPSVPHDCVLVLDATVGQNAHAQVGVFRDMVDVTGLMVTKLDGSARGGVVVALAEAFGLPVHAAGVGEGIDDLRPFEAGAFARALMGLED